jgi:hypothetical protein
MSKDIRGIIGEARGESTRQEDLRRHGATRQINARSIRAKTEPTKYSHVGSLEVALTVVAATGGRFVAKSQIIRRRFGPASAANW